MTPTPQAPPPPEPVSTVLELLRREARPLDVAAIKRRLAALDVEDVEATWAAVGPVLRRHAQVHYAGKKYGLVEAAPPTAEEALAQLAALAGDLAEPHRSALVALVRAELAAARTTTEELAQARRQASEVDSLRARLAELERQISASAAAPAPAPPPAAASVPVGQSPAEYERAERRRLARERQARIEAMTKVADLAGEVEELVAKRATNEVLLESTRTLVSVAGLEPIGAGGDRADYDESLHEAIGDTPGAGATVIVVRPGYRWRAPGEVVLISRAQVRLA